MIIKTRKIDIKKLKIKMALTASNELSARNHCAQFYTCETRSMIELFRSQN